MAETELTMQARGVAAFMLAAPNVIGNPGVQIAFEHDAGQIMYDFKMALHDAHVGLHDPKAVVAQTALEMVHSAVDCFGVPSFAQKLAEVGVGVMEGIEFLEALPVDPVPPSEPVVAPPAP